MSSIVTDGEVDADILVVCEPASEGAYNSGYVMRKAATNTFRREALKQGFGREDFAFISAAPPLDDDARASEGRANKYIDSYRGEFLAEFEKFSPKLIIYLGKYAGKALLGRPVKITSHRGQVHEGVEATNLVPYLPLFSPNHVLQRPEIKDIYESDFRLAGVFRDSGYSFEIFSKSMQTGDYRWVTDLGFLLDEPPDLVAVDTETTSLEWYGEGCRVLCVQISYAKHMAVCVPLDIGYWNDPERVDESSEHLPRLNGRTRQKLVGQLKELLGNPDVRCVFHNGKYDMHVLLNHGVEVANFHADTMQLAFVCDDNMQSKTLADCVRRWCPEMSGYSDDFDRKTDKSRMWLVNHADMLNYGCGDTDSTRRLAFRMQKIARGDVGNFRCYEKIQMPALRMFFHMEREGIKVDRGALQDLVEMAGEMEKEMYEDLIAKVPGSIKTLHLENPKMKGKAVPDALNFNRADFLIDWLFRHPDGFCFEPREYTATTRHLAVGDRVPSTSAKDHLPYFDHEEVVADLIDYKRLSKMRTTYIGEPVRVEHRSVPLLKSGKKYGKAAQDLVDGHELPVAYAPPKTAGPVFGEEIPAGAEAKKDGVSLVVDNNGIPWWREVKQPTGFWKYLSPDSYIHSSFFLHVTNTGRSNSRSPNNQNVPKRGRTERTKKLVKAFRNIFVAPDGGFLIEGDISQAELRATAWMAKDTAMLEVYRRGGDIHTTTAMKVMGISRAHWDSLDDDERALNRFRAKAVNFGLIFGMSPLGRKEDDGHGGFRRYAKVDYGIDLTEDEALKIWNNFFDTYAQLRGWHREMKDTATKYGHVRALHGALRRLPSVDSSEDRIKGGALRMAVNSPIQRFASDLGLMGMFRFGRDCPWERFRPVAFVHDAVWVSGESTDDAEEAMSSLKWYMQTPPLRRWFDLKTPVPILADVSTGPRLGEMEEREVEAARPDWYAGD